jgi:hypothetical protein
MQATAGNLLRERGTKTGVNGRFDYLNPAAVERISQHTFMVLPTIRK